LASAHAFTHETDYSPTFGGLEISAKGKKIESYPSLIFGQNNILSDFTCFETELRITRVISPKNQNINIKKKNIINSCKYNIFVPFKKYYAVQKKIKKYYLHHYQSKVTHWETLEVSYFL
jgi:hypothetical protein